MRHGKKLNHLGRKTPHRKAMMANMASSLIKHKRITTTVAKAKALRMYVEPLLTKGKEANTHNYRTVFSYLQDKVAVNELFTVIGEKISKRNGGYTRILKLGNRAGDNADMAFIELVDFNEYFDGFGKSTQSKSKRTRRGRSGSASAPSEKVSTSKKAVTATEIEDAVIIDNDAVETSVVEEISTSAENNVSTEATVSEIEIPAVETITNEVEVPVIETAVQVEETVAVTETNAAVEETTSAESNSGDDLTVIDGIGPAFAERLNKLGIFSFTDLANLTDDRISELEQSDSMTSLEEWHNWIDQAKSRM